MQVSASKPAWLGTKAALKPKAKPSIASASAMQPPNKWAVNAAEDGDELVDEEELLTEEDKKPAAAAPPASKGAAAMTISLCCSNVRRHRSRDSALLLPFGNSSCHPSAHVMASLSRSISHNPRMHCHTGDCDVGAGKKACKNCSCGRAEQEAAQEAGGKAVTLTTEMLENPQSACGSVSHRINHRAQGAEEDSLRP